MSKIKLIIALRENTGKTQNLEKVIPMFLYILLECLSKTYSLRNKQVNTI